MRKDTRDPLATNYEIVCNISVYQRNEIIYNKYISCFKDFLLYWFVDNNSAAVLILSVLDWEGVPVLIKSLNSPIRVIRVSTHLYLVSQLFTQILTSALYKYDKLEMENCCVWIKSRKISFYVNNHQPIYQSGFGPKSRR